MNEAKGKFFSVKNMAYWDGDEKKNRSTVEIKTQRKTNLVQKWWRREARRVRTLHMFYQVCGTEVGYSSFVF